MSKMFALLAILFFFVPTGASASASQKDEVIIVEWICDFYEPEKKQLQNCHRQNYTRNPFQVLLLGPLSEETVTADLIVTTVLVPPSGGKQGTFEHELIFEKGEIWKVRVMGTPEGPWADGWYEAFALIPQ